MKAASTAPPPPQQLRDDPQDAWTAAFLGLGTIWHSPPGTPALTGATIQTPWGPLRLEAGTPGPLPTGLDPDLAAERLCLLIRPEAIRPADASGVTAAISDVRITGDRTVATFEVPGAPPLDGYVPTDLPKKPHRIKLDPEGITLLSAERPQTPGSEATRTSN